MEKDPSQRFLGSTCEYVAQSKRHDRVLSERARRHLPLPIKEATQVPAPLMTAEFSGVFRQIALGKRSDAHSTRQSFGICRASQTQEAVGAHVRAAAFESLTKAARPLGELVRGTQSAPWQLVPSHVLRAVCGTL